MDARAGRAKTSNDTLKALIILPFYLIAILFQKRLYGCQNILVRIKCVNWTPNKAFQMNPLRGFPGKRIELGKIPHLINMGNDFNDSRTAVRSQTTKCG